MTDYRPVNAQAIERAVELLREGKLVAIPTETVYGLAADASDPDAVRRIFAAKGRPERHPVIVHVADADTIEDTLSGWTTDIPEAAQRLARAFWPGPLTMIVKRGPKAHDGITGGRDTVGLRVPGHPWALAVVRAFGDGIAAPSANRFGHISPTTAQHVIDGLGDRVSMVLDGGPCPVGVESTIVDLSGTTARLLRPGMITPTELETVLEAPLTTVAVTQSVAQSEAPGTLASHYAPRAPLTIVPTADFGRAVDTAIISGEYPGVLSFSGPPHEWPTDRWITLPATPDACAQQLYASLRTLDQSSPVRIIAEAVPSHGRWIAIADRLRRAAAPR